MKLGVNTTNYLSQGKLKRLSRFSIVGVLNTLMDFTIFTLFHSLFQLNYAVSQIAGYNFGIANSFIFNRNWTFGDKNADKKTVHELLQFIGINLVSLIITIIFMKILVNTFNINVYVSKIMVTLIAQVTNFLGYKIWVFK